jgi:hypothetical protein
MHVSDEDRKRLELLYELYKRAGTNGEMEAALAAMVRILGKYGLGRDDIERVLTAPQTSLPAPNLLDLLDNYFDYWVWMSPRDRAIAAGWGIHLHVFAKFEITPRFTILTPQGEYGWAKTTLLKMLQHLAPRPMPPIDVSPTPAALHQAIDNGATALFLDEVDNLNLKQNGELRALLNAFERGYRRRRAGNRPKGGGKPKPQEYDPFIPIAVAAVGRLPKALMTRSFVINMKLKPADVYRPSIREDPVLFQLMANIAHDAIATWASNVTLEQKVDTGVDNRFADLWRPLISIADTMDAGYRMRSIAKAVTSEFCDYSDGMQMRISTRLIFKKLDVDRIDREDLHNELLDLEEWNEWGRPHPLTRNELNSIIRDIGVRPAHTFRRKGTKHGEPAGGWGWESKDFEEAWRICPPEKEEK